MKKEFRAHPLMIVNLVKPFLFVLIFPLVKGLLQYIIEKEITGVLTLEIFLFSVILIIGVLRWRAFRLICTEKDVIIRMGIIIKQKSVINIKKLSSVQSTRNPLDAVFRSVTYRINTEAGSTTKSDFEFKLSMKDSKEVSMRLYGKHNPTAVKFSAVKVAVMAATTSSAVSGMIVGVPILNRAGKLLGIALDKMLLDEINNVSGKIETVFPPIVNTITLILLLAYAVSFVYSFITYINFKLYLEKDKLEVRSGFFVHSRTAFKKSSVNDVTIEQTPLMRLFRRYEMKVSVGGYGKSKNEKAVIVPSGRKKDIHSRFADYFPFLVPDRVGLKAKRGLITKNRFLFISEIWLGVTVALAITLSVIFSDFTRLILFLTAVDGGLILYYSYLCLYEYRAGTLKMGKSIYARGVKGFNICELYCPMENVGEIKIMRTIPDFYYKTCRITIYVRSESADKIRVRHLNIDEVKQGIFDCYKINV